MGLSTAGKVGLPLAKVLGKLLFGGVGRTAVTVGVGDQVITGGEGRKALMEKGEGVIDDHMQQQAYDLMAPMLGWETDKDKNPGGYARDFENFQRRWEQIEPGKMGVALGAGLGINMVAKSLGLGGLGWGTTLVIATAYHFLMNTEYGAQARNWVTNQPWAKSIGIDGMFESAQNMADEFNPLATGKDSGSDSKAPETAQEETVERELETTTPAASAPPPAGMKR